MSGPITLSEFLHSRLDEDEQAAEQAVTHDPARALAEVDAKRQIIEQHPDVNDGDCGTCVRGLWGYPTNGGSSIEPWPCPTLRLLALPYAEHPDYQAEWAPYCGGTLSDP